MQPHTFIADSAAHAVEQIRQALGPQAVVLNVRKLPAQGLARFWQKPRIEVLACLPQPPPQTDDLAQLRQELAEIKQTLSPGESPARPGSAPGSAGIPAGGLPFYCQPSLSRNTPAEMPALPGTVSGGASPSHSLHTPWQAGALLERSGLLPVHVQRVLDEASAQTGGQLPASLAEELEVVRRALVSLWPNPHSQRSNRHVFIGPPGAGKTTVLSKWLAQAVLVEGRWARVWRLDGQVANTAESLSVFAEILGVPVERFWPSDSSAPSDPSDLLFVDLPGVNWNDAPALEALAKRLAAFAGADLHLVLNAAYETQSLLSQGRAYSRLAVTDVILTHLDEDPRWGKLWNFVLGTNYTITHLSAGQNMPGDFLPADPQQILARFLPRKQPIPTRSAVPSAGWQTSC